MGSPNLTRDQARERASLVDDLAYAIDLDLTDGSGAPGMRTFHSRTTVTFSATAGANTFIDLIADAAPRVELNGVAVDTSGYTPEGGVAIGPLAEHNTLVVEADCLYSNTGEGLHRFVDPTDDAVYLYSQFETADAKRMFACFDQPDLKATFDVVVTAPADWTVVSNGAPLPAGEPGRVAFVRTKLLSTYLVALIAGPYAEFRDVYTDEHGEIPLGVYARASLREFVDAERLFTETKQGFGFYHSKFGVPYPFGKYDQLFVPEFNAGAMENAGAVTFLEDYIFRSRVTGYLYERRAETILHEMAHMWFGDLVTMRWWDDLWLNESFATFASVLSQAAATEYTDAWTTFANVEKSWAYRQDQLPSTHPVAADIPDLQAVEVNFDGITYAKGASVLKQLVAYVGLEPFLAGLRDYFAEHAYANASFGDLISALESASGRDLSEWGAQWLKTTGINIIRPDLDVDADGVVTRFEIVQEGATPGAGETRVHRLAVGVYDDVDGRLERVRRVELDVTGERTAVPELVGTPRGAMILVNDDDLTYCSLRLDAESLTTAVARIGDIADSLPRTIVWSAAWEMTRQAELKPRDFLSLVAAGIGAETHIGVVQRVLGQAQATLQNYVDPDWAAQTGWPAFAGRALQLAREAEAGSDHQLAFVSALLAAPLDDDQVTVARSLLDGVDPADLGLPGLAVDADLRWALVIALATAGAIDTETEPAATPVIDAEARRDPTAAGARQAAKARAARPLAEAKAHAWQLAVEDDSISNTHARAIIAGFHRPGQEALLAPYTERYFASAGEVWRRRTSEVAQTVIIGLYPTWDVSTDALAAADAFLATDLPPALHRLILEGRDPVARALRVRAFDAS